MQHWLEHYHKLFSCETTVSEGVPNVILRLCNIKEFSIEPSIDEPEKIIPFLTFEKPEGRDGILAEVLKQGGQIVL